MFSAWSNHESEYPSCEGHVSESREAETLCLNNTAVSTCHEGKNVSQHSKTWCSWYCRYWQFFAQESFSAWIHVVKWFVFQPFSVFGQSLTTFPDLLQVMSHGDTSLILGLIPLNKMYISPVVLTMFFLYGIVLNPIKAMLQKKRSRLVPKDMPNYHRHRFRWQSCRRTWCCGDVTWDCLQIRGPQRSSLK